jgi:drug/metabolite transporter (DMT)-like permease
VLRAASSNWLTVWNHLGAALFLLPAALWQGTSLTSPQVGVLAVFGVVQLGFPYWLMARGLRVVSPQEAGILALLEPLLNPLWAFLAAPEAEAPTIYTFAGGACILGALVWRYWPARPSDTARG